MNFTICNSTETASLYECINIVHGQYIVPPLLIQSIQRLVSMSCTIVAGFVAKLHRVFIMYLFIYIYILCIGM